MIEGEIHWRPNTDFCWHAFKFDGEDKIVSLCGCCKIFSDEIDKVARPPFFFRCAGCAEIESAGSRNLPTSRGWKSLNQEVQK